jgi:hypothetical protein
VVNATTRPLYSQERDRIRIVQEVGWAPGPVWTGAENLVPSRIRFLDRVVSAESLYSLRYPYFGTIQGVIELLCKFTGVVEGLRRRTIRGCKMWSEMSPFYGIRCQNVVHRCRACDVVDVRHFETLL